MQEKQFFALDWQFSDREIIVAVSHLFLLHFYCNKNAIIATLKNRALPFPRASGNLSLLLQFRIFHFFRKKSNMWHV